MGISGRVTGWGHLPRNCPRALYATTIDNDGSDASEQMPVCAESLSNRKPSDYSHVLENYTLV